MGLKCGIVGLPNVGKSTLFNVLTKSNNAESANYPFCTIEPNIGLVELIDDRLNKISKIANSKKTIHSVIEFVDIAGLVKGASKGEGLGNKFLSHIREVDGIIHVVRCFKNNDITHVYNDINPVRDIEIIETELILADIETLNKKIQNLSKKNQLLEQEAQEELEISEFILPKLEDGKMAYQFITNSNKQIIKRLHLLTSKPIMYLCNVGEEDISSDNEYVKKVKEFSNNNSESRVITICSKIEEEIANLNSPEEQKEFMESLNIKESGLKQVIYSAYKLLNLSCFFTAGEKETRSWTFRNGMLAPETAGIIHTDFETGFIKAEVISFDDYIKYNGYTEAKNAGKARIEGKSYLVKDGDIIIFRFNN